MFDNYDANGLHEPKKNVHIPFLDVDDLAFKNRHDPNFVASISIFCCCLLQKLLVPFLYKMKIIKANMMQVPATITLTNGSSKLPSRQANIYAEISSFPMDIPEKLTGLNQSLFWSVLIALIVSI